MDNNTKTILKWTYEPKDYFEERCTLSHAGGYIIIADGEIKGEFEASCYDLGQEFRDSAHRQVTTAFAAQQVQTHLGFKLSAAAMSRQYPDGRRDVTAFVDPLQIKVSGGRADIVIKDAQGNVVQDTKAERLKKQKAFRENIACLLPTDLPLKRMLQSFNNAIEDKDNLFIHLYEVRETLVSEFGSSTAAMSTTNASLTDWRKFGRLANSEPLLEGRHRGKHNSLRSAESADIDWALRFTQELIEMYVEFKNNH